MKVLPETGLFQEVSCDKWPEFCSPEQLFSHSGLVLASYWTYFPLFFHISEIIQHWSQNISELVLLGSVPGHSRCSSHSPET